MTDEQSALVEAAIQIAKSLYDYDVEAGRDVSNDNPFAFILVGLFLEQLLTVKEGNAHFELN